MAVAGALHTPAPEFATKERAALVRAGLRDKRFHLAGALIPVIALALGFWPTVIAGSALIVGLAVLRARAHLNGTPHPNGLRGRLLRVACGADPARKRCEGKHPYLSTYLLAVLGSYLAAWFAGHLPVFCIVVVVLAVHDGLAAVFGGAYGRHRFPYSRKTLEGTLGALVVSLPAVLGMTALACGWLAVPFSPLYSALAVGGLAAGAALETLEIRNDNAVLAALLTASLLGIALVVGSGP